MKSVTESLDYLCSTDELCAQAKARMKYQEHHMKTAKALAYLEAKGTQGEREQLAYASDEYKYAKEALENAVADYETMANKRKTAELTIEVWRSQNANKRSGNI